jgi:arylsulfatase A-like enzyme
MGIFSGLLPSSTGVYHNEPFWSAPDRPSTFIEQLRAAGYHTACAGKVFHGMFDYALAGRHRLGAAPWREIENRPDLWDTFHPMADDLLPASRPLNGLFDFSNFDAIDSWYHLFDWGPSPDGMDHRLPDAVTVGQVTAFLRDPPTQPFFCAAGLYKPHLPWHVPQRFFDLYPLESVAVPVIREDDLDDAPPLAKAWALSPPDHELITSRRLWKNAVQGYLACISYADEQVGKILAALASGSAADNTIIILCGDNGFHLGEKLHWRKFVLWEEATRVPLIFTGPGINPRRRYAVPVSLLDLYATILDSAGLPFEGRDASTLRPLMGGQQDETRSRSVIMTWGANNHSIRTPRWRMTRYVDGGLELFDHASDPMEWVNLADRPDLEATRAELNAQIDAQCG